MELNGFHGASLQKLLDSPFLLFVLFAISKEHTKLYVQMRSFYVCTVVLCSFRNSRLVSVVTSPPFMSMQYKNIT